VVGVVSPPKSSQRSNVGSKSAASFVRGAGTPSTGSGSAVSRVQQGVVSSPDNSQRSARQVSPLLPPKTRM
jgi:hypothetical protein